MDKLELRKAWRSDIEYKGGHCPVCDRWGKIYGRNLNRSMARALIWLCSATKDEDGWVDVANKSPRWLVKTNQIQSCRWWGLVESKPTDETDDDSKSSSGFWRPTQAGLDFVFKHTRVPKKVFTYNADVEGISEETVFIEDCFKEFFDYQDVMNTYFKKGK